MQLEILTLDEVSQKEKDKYHNITTMWNLKYGTSDPVYKKKQTHGQRTDLQLPSRREWDGLGFWV